MYKSRIIYLDSWFLKARPIGCPEASVRNYRYTLLNNPEERSLQVLRDRSLTSRELPRIRGYQGMNLREALTGYNYYKSAQSDIFIIFMFHKSQPLNIISTFHLFVKTNHNFVSCLSLPHFVVVQ
jgi:hypothetical protein